MTKTVIKDSPDWTAHEREVQTELYSILVRYLKPTTISKLLNDIEADVDIEWPFQHVIEILQEYHTHVMAQRAEAEERD
jgi:hypothetical protein